MMSEQEFETRWAELQTAEAADLAQQEAKARAQAEMKLQAKLETLADRVREAHSRPKALLIYEALTPDEHDCAMKQERVAEVTELSRPSIADYSQFGHWQVYVSGADIKSTILKPLFFDRLTLRRFLGLMSMTECQVGGRSGWKERQRDYERRFQEVISRINDGAGQPITREEVYAELEKLATRKKPTLVAAILQHLEQMYPDRVVTARFLNDAIGSFKKKGGFYTETVETAQGLAVRVRKVARVDPVRAHAAVAEVAPLLEQIIELAGRTTARTSLVQISANAQKVLQVLKHLQAAAEAEPR
jgi:hypothetical protein